MDDASRLTLSRIATNQPVLREHEYVAEQLQRRGYLISSKEGQGLFSSTFASFVKSRDGAPAGGRSFFGNVTSLFRRRES
jgi:hypothetical protein